jgi:hypothetical protein
VQYPVYSFETFGHARRISTPRCKRTFGILFSAVSYTSLGAYWTTLARLKSPIFTDPEKIVQEAKVAAHVLVACGESVFDLAVFTLLALDLTVSSQPGLKMKRKSVPFSKHLRGLLFEGTIIKRQSLWIRVVEHHIYQCADARDHVFGLLYESPDRHGARRAPAICPDYTKSTLQILLQLLEQGAYGMEQYHDSRFEHHRQISSGPSCC